MNEYPLGQAVRLSATFANASDVVADPTTVTLTIGRQEVSPPPAPTGTSFVHGVDLTLVKDSTGNYHLDYTGAASGIYVYRWVGTGTVATASLPRYFKVTPNPFA
jgi:hypothetical protein